MLPTGSWTVAVWPAATPLKLGVVTRFRMSLPRVAALRRAQEARAAELAQQEAGDDHPDDHGDGRHGDLFDVHGKELHREGRGVSTTLLVEPTLRAIAASAQRKNRFPS